MKLEELHPGLKVSYRLREGLLIPCVISSIDKKKVVLALDDGAPFKGQIFADPEYLEARR